jgi:hypothetical protein
MPAPNIPIGPRNEKVLVTTPVVKDGVVELNKDGTIKWTAVKTPYYDPNRLIHMAILRSGVLMNSGRNIHNS